VHGSKEVDVRREEGAGSGGALTMYLAEQVGVLRTMLAAMAS
jgi:hypothetical protein